MSHKSIKLAAAIVNRGAGNRAAAIFHTYNHEILLAVRGHGTASSAVMDCLGLDEPEKDLVLGLSSKADADRLLRALGREMEFSKPGHGIAFTLSLTGISFAAMDILSRHEDQSGPNSRPAEHKEDIPMTNSHSYELIASVIHTDLSAPVMEAARKAGCQGGTLIKAREIAVRHDPFPGKSHTADSDPHQLKGSHPEVHMRDRNEGDRRTRSGNFPARGCSGGTDRLILAEKTAFFLG